ncbi:rubrerythrin family protein [Streptomyces sp. ET3-23]|uniref:ferritin family protein n=1 Tax=Streptomyces sp. ET3-23 TaxID=2885643 RepID=UPI001D11FD3A|nr:ferritin family protein [Streptomyces sp. ET3-23]MCC2273980.1 rubrerythrin family protein [Streptomyces sp. ET3-23]
MTPLRTRTLVAGLTACLVSAGPLGTASASPLPADRLPLAAEGTDHGMDTQTRKNLDDALRGEAFAHASYTLYAAQAHREGRRTTGLLYLRTARVELGDHFRAAAKLAKLVGSDAANLGAAVSGEAYEAVTMYPTFARQAKEDGDDKAAELFSEIAKDEASHREAFQTALNVIETGKGTIPAPPKATVVTVKAGPPKVKAARTKANLDTAMHGEAMADAKYTLYAQHARRAGRQALARLFEGAATVELREHFAGEADLAGLVGRTRQNLRTTIRGEQDEAHTIYRRFARQARKAGCERAARMFEHNAYDEAEHARAMQRAAGRHR